MDRPGIASRLLLESPSLFVAHRRLLKYSRYFRQWPAKVFLAIGSRESGREDKDRQGVEDVHELEQIMRRAGLGEGRLRVKIEDGATHSEEAWARRLPEALTFLLGESRGG
jgi:predicted alpha/beta superfamily hydrolase